MSTIIEGAIIDLADGNPGAVRTLADVAVEREDDTIQVYAELMKRDVRGPLIWVGYSDHCKSDIDCFVDGVLDGDEELFAEIEAYREKLEASD